MLVLYEILRFSNLIGPKTLSLLSKNSRKQTIYGQTNSSYSQYC